MRKQYLIWAALFVLALVGISVRGGMVSYLFLALTVAVPCVCALYLVYVFLCFRIYQDVDRKTVVKGELLPYRFVLANEFPVAFTHVDVTFHQDYSTTREIPEHAGKTLLPGEAVRFETVLTGRYRGEYPVGIREAEIMDFLHLFVLRYRSPSEIRLQVLPRVLAPEEMSWLELEHSQLEELLGIRRTEPDIPVREYQDGDPLTMVHWKSTARSGKMMSRTMIGEKRRSITLYLDRSLRDYPTELDRLASEDKMLELALSLLNYLALEDLAPKAAMESGPVTVTPDRFDEIYEKLSKEYFREKESFAAQITAAYDAEATEEIWITTEVTEELAALALGRSESGRRLLVFVISEQDDDPLAGLHEERIRRIRISPKEE